MAKIEKLKKGTATIYPATIPQAVVDPTDNKTLSTKLTEIDDSVSQLAGDLVLKEATANKQNSLTPDGTGEKFPTLDAVNTGLSTKQTALVSGTNIKTVNGQSLLGSGDVSNLIVSYTHSGNKEVKTTDVDLATGVFTSVGHGLLDGDGVFPILENGYLLSAYGIIRPFPTGLDYVKYFIVNKTNDTFQIALTSGGAAVTFTSNSEMNLSVWHFERNDTYKVSLINITEPNTKIIFNGWSFGAWLYLSPVSTGNSNAAPFGFAAHFKYTTSGGYINFYGGPINVGGSGYYSLQRETRALKTISTKVEIIKIAKNTINGDNITKILSESVSLYQKTQPTMTSVDIGNNNSSIIANGTIIEVYKL